TFEIMSLNGGFVDLSGFDLNDVIIAAPFGVELQTFIDNNVANPVPEPTTFALLGIGLAGLAFYRKKLVRKGKVNEAGNGC
ncbi:MAG: PEP-CTERM sorting domain-containing protein, partial [Candidatus Anammoxibacter sp.]